MAVTLKNVVHSLMIFIGGGEVQDGKSPSSLLFGAISPSSLNLV